MKLRRDSKSYKILKSLLVAGGFILISSVSPQSGAKIIKELVRNYFYKKKFEKRRLLRDLKRLQSRSFVDYKELPDGRIELVLTKLGKEKILTYNIDEIKLDTSKEWDKKWRLVMFDIPHYKKKARDAFRQKLKILGFYPVQKSAFVTPYECENEIDFVASFFGVRDNILLSHINNFEKEEKLRRYFNL